MAHLSLLLAGAAAVAQPFGPPGIPPTAFPPLCSIAPQVAAQAPSSTVLNFTDGTHARCASVIVPPGVHGPLPILFDFHGAGGNAGNFGARRDRLGVSWLSLATNHSFAVVGGEAIQWTAKGPAPAPGPPSQSNCTKCFELHGCSKAQGQTQCLACMKQHQFGPRSCLQVCKAEHVPFPSVVAAVCGPDDHAFTHENSPDSWGGNMQRLEELPGGGGSPNPHLHGGQWTIPEVQTDATGLVCDWDRNLDLRYINATLSTLEVAGAENGGRLFDLDKIFFTGCSMGSAYTVWVAQCVHQRMPAAVTAFASQSTGLKVKGDGLRFPPDNYITNSSVSWGECDACQYFPAPVSKTEGLKACVVDQTEDPRAEEPFFYKSSVALHSAWLSAGMRSHASYSKGGHCQTDNYTWIAECLDDGTGRLLDIGSR